jgi:type IV pilus assembly protein PilM
MPFDGQQPRSLFAFETFVEEHERVRFLEEWFKARASPMIGLDISSSSLKLVELGQSASGHYVVNRVGQQALEEGLVVEGEVERFDEVAEAVRRLVLRSGTKIRRVAMALPQASVITRKITVPAGLREDEMELQVESEVNQYVPFSMDEVSLDYCVVGPSPTAPDELEVMVAASRKDNVRDRQALAEAAGLEPAVLDIESHASRLAITRWAACLPRQGKGAVIALFEIGADSTGLKVLSNDELLYDRDQAFGGAQLTKLIAQQYGFSLAQAERHKIEGTLPSSYLDLHEPYVDSVAQEMGRALQYFFTSTAPHQVDHVLLAGGTAILAGLADRVREVTGIDCMVVNPFDSMHMGSGVSPDRLAREAPSYLVACGLAMRRFHP